MTAKELIDLKENNAATTITRIISCLDKEISEHFEDGELVINIKNAFVGGSLISFSGYINEIRYSLIDRGFKTELSPFKNILTIKWTKGKLDYSLYDIIYKMKKFLKLI